MATSRRRDHHRFKKKKKKDEGSKRSFLPYGVPCGESIIALSWPLTCCNINARLLQSRIADDKLEMQRNELMSFLNVTSLSSCSNPSSDDDTGNSEVSQVCHTNIIHS